MRTGTLLQIAQLGQPCLRERVHNSGTFASQQLIDDMMATLEDSGGVGLAAPQVFRGLKIFIVSLGKGVRSPLFKGPTAIINPCITRRSKAVELGWEGCLSVPGIRVRVPRHFKISVEFLDREGRTKSGSIQGFVSRVFQHEFDHLRGIIHFDRAKSKDIVMEKEYQRIIRGK